MTEDRTAKLDQTVDDLHDKLRAAADWASALKDVVIARREHEDID